MNQVTHICSFCNKLSSEYHEKWGGKKFWHSTCLKEHYNGPTGNMTRPKGVNGKGLVDDKERQKIHRWVKDVGALPAGFTGNKLSLSSASKLLSTEQRLKLEEFLSQSSNIGTKSATTPSTSITSQDRQIFAAIQGAVVRQSADVVPVDRKLRSAPQPQNIEKTETELIAAARNNDWRCFGCLAKFGLYIEVGNDFKRMTVEHGHITKARAAGGTKEDDYPVCPVCQRIQGQGSGIPVADFQQLVKNTFAERGYRHVKVQIERI